MNKKIYGLVLASLFTALIIVGAFIKIPIGAIPITMQTLFVILAPLLIGRKAVYSVATYIAIGLIGFPVFTSGGGIGSVMTPTFGFLISFIPVAFVIAMMTKNRSGFLPFLLATFVGTIIIYIFGTIWYFVYTGFSANFLALISATVLPFIWGDIAKCLVATIIATRLKPLIIKTTH